MAFLSHQQIATTAAVKTVSDLTVPAEASHAQLQSGTQDMRYTMDGSSAPAQAVGMVLKVGLAPETFLIEDIRNIKFVRGAGSNGVVDIHYFGG